MEKPKNIEDYLDWHKQTTGEELNRATAQAYELNLRSLKQAVVNHAFVERFANDTKDHVQRGLYSKAHELVPSRGWLELRLA